jgi:hypothetical protein
MKGKLTREVQISLQIEKGEGRRGRGAVLWQKKAWQKIYIYIHMC